MVDAQAGMEVQSSKLQVESVPEARMALVHSSPSTGAQSPDSLSSVKRLVTLGRKAAMVIATQAGAVEPLRAERKDELECQSSSKTVLVR